LIELGFSDYVKDVGKSRIMLLLDMIADCIRRYPSGFFNNSSKKHTNCRQSKETAEIVIIIISESRASVNGWCSAALVPRPFSPALSLLSAPLLIAFTSASCRSNSCISETISSTSKLLLQLRRSPLKLAPCVPLTDRSFLLV